MVWSGGILVNQSMVNHEKNVQSEYGQDSQVSLFNRNDINQNGH